MSVKLNHNVQYLYILNCLSNNRVFTKLKKKVVNDFNKYHDLVHKKILHTCLALIIFGKKDKTF